MLEKESEPLRVFFENERNVLLCSFKFLDITEVNGKVLS